MNEMNQIKIILGTKPTEIELSAAEDLKSDLQQTVENKIVITSEFSKKQDDSTNKTSLNFILGTPETNEIIEELSKTSKIPITASKPGPRGGGIFAFEEISSRQLGKSMVLAGSDPQGTQYITHDFSHEYLKIDPFSFWTGHKPPKIKEISRIEIQPTIMEPPAVPILCYFDNDNDELANMTKPYLEFSFLHWKELIDTLVRLKYNAIDIHDHLGRAEFYRWPFYKNLVPDYHPNEKLLNKVIDYAHKMGMKIQVSFYLGWKFKTISDRANKNYKNHKKEWFNVWKYYLEHTPIGKCDIFLNRPRDQKWDRRYKGADYETTAKLFNEIFHEMRNILRTHNPDAVIIIDLYSEGMTVYRKGLEPEPKEDFIMAWPDDGFGRIPHMPKSLKDYKFGIYMHAGYFLNHVVHDPYPELLSKDMKKAFIDYGMTQYCLVNGQTFRHYLLNLEACSKLCYNPHAFNSDDFYIEWSTRYFGENAAINVVKILKTLHEAQDGGLGYVKVIGKINESILRLKLMKRLFFLPKRTVRNIFNRFTQLGSEFTYRLKKNIEMLQNALNLAQKTKPNVECENYFYNDQIILQVKLLLQLNELAHELQCAAFDHKNEQHIINAVNLLREHTDTRLKGDENPQWKTWYDPDKRRPNGGYPDIERLRKLI